MTSPREAVSILTAAALVVAPVGGVAATYTTGYAEDQAAKHTAEEKAFPKTYEELAERIEAGGAVLAGRFGCYGRCENGLSDR